MSEGLQAILAVVVTVFDLFITKSFFKTCLGEEHIRVSSKFFSLIYVLLFTLDFGLSQFGLAGLFYVVKSEIIFIALSLLYDARWMNRLFTTLSYLVFGMISELVSYGIVVSTFSNTPEESLQNYSIMLSKLILFFWVEIVSLFIRKNTRLVQNREYICFSLIPLLSILTLIIISYNFDTGEPRTSAGICVAALGIILINLLVFYLLEHIIEAAEIRQKQTHMEQQFLFQERRYEQSSQAFRSICGVIHDTNKHLVYISECLDRREYSEAKRYIETTKNHVERSYKRIYTGYLPIDALVSNALNVAEENHITFTTEIHIEQKRIQMERYDLCVALGNLLDNAIEACKKVDHLEDRRIEVSIATTENSLVIYIVNSKEYINDANLKSNKENKWLHGHGICNVNVIAEKYGGVFTVECLESVFKATLIVPI